MASRLLKRDSMNRNRLTQLAPNANVEAIIALLALIFLVHTASRWQTAAAAGDRTPMLHGLVQLK